MSQSNRIGLGAVPLPTFRVWARTGRVKEVPRALIRRYCSSGPVRSGGRAGGERPVFTGSAHLYDAVYRAFKDYAAEAAQVAGLLASLHPACAHVLDVGCGTGEHAVHLRRSHALRVDGLDLDPQLLAVARRKLPEAEFFVGDMADFALPRRYDAVICLFSAIGYVRTLDRVAAALACFRRHVEAGGLVVVEPWFEPGLLRIGAGEVRESATAAGRVRRASHVTVEGTLSRIVFDYTVHDAEGVREFQEVHELGLFTGAEMRAAFRQAGLAAAFDPVGFTGRGLYTARVAA